MTVCPQNLNEMEVTTHANQKQELQTDREEMSNLHRGHFIDASFQVSVVAMFANQSGRNEQSS
jgi:hypothetical protein